MNWFIFVSMPKNNIHPLFRKRATNESDSGRKVRIPSEKAFLLGEYIGERVKVVWSNRKELQGIEGEVEDESYGSLVIRSDGRKRRIPKVGNVFEFQRTGVTVDGKTIVCRPEERTKKLARRL